MPNLNIINVKQGSEEWLKLRSQKIGASDAPAILGVSPWSTPFQLMEEKMGLSIREKTSCMQFGITNEETARQEFEKLTGLIMFPTVAVSKKRPWQMASYDGLTLEQDVAVEIKNSGQTDHNISCSGNIPDHYMPQLQQQMEVGDLHEMLYFSYHKGQGKIVEVKRDQNLIDFLNEEEEKFWNLWQKGQMPELTERDYVDMSYSLEWKEKADLLTSLKKSIKLNEDLSESLKEDLKNLCQEKSARGHGIQLSKYISKGNIEYAKIPELAGVDLEAYRKKPFTKWMLSSIK